MHLSRGMVILNRLMGDHRKKGMEEKEVAGSLGKAEPISEDLLIKQDMGIEAVFIRGV